MRSCLLVGYGRMGKIVERLAPDYGFEVVGHLDDTNNIGGRRHSVGAGCRRGRRVLHPVGGCRESSEARRPQDERRHRHDRLARARREDARRSRPTPASASSRRRTFRWASRLFQSLAEQAAKLFAPYPQYGAWIHEIHHSAKKDAPSGTAITLQQGMKDAGYAPQHRHGVEPRGIGAGHAHGWFRWPVRNDYDDAHESRSRGVRAGRAAGREVGARAKRGWFTIRDVLGNLT